MLCILLSLQLVLPIITIMIFGDTITFLSCYFFLYFPSLFFHAFFRFSLPSFHFPCSSTQKQTQTSLTRSHCLRSNTKRKGWVAWASQRQRTAIKYSECWPTLENNYHYDDGPSAWNLPALASNSALVLPTEFLFRVICCDPLILFLCCYFFLLRVVIYCSHLFLFIFFSMSIFVSFFPLCLCLFVFIFEACVHLLFPIKYVLLFVCFTLYLCLSGFSTSDRTLVCRINENTKIMMFALKDLWCFIWRHSYTNIVNMYA